jgi:hypothetical protein
MENIPMQDGSELISSRERLLVMQREIAVIKAQIEKAKARVLVDGTYSDPEWFAAANASLRFKQVEYQRLQLDLGAGRGGESNHSLSQRRDVPAFDVSMIFEREPGNALKPSLHDQAIAVLHDIASIKAQLDRANSRGRDSRKYSDPEWFQAANAALKYKQLEHQRLLHEISQQQRIAKALRVEKEQQLQKTFERAFIRVARELLDKDTYVRLLQETERRTPTKPVEETEVASLGVSATDFASPDTEPDDADCGESGYGPSPGG